MITKYLSVRDVATALSMTSAGVIAMIHEGVFDSAFRTGDHKRCPWKIARDEVDSFIANRQEAARREINLRRTGQAMASQILRELERPRRSA
jgi:hypothetical protein